jgi:hypothetical protein
LVSFQNFSNASVLKLQLHNRETIFEKFVLG